MPNNILPRTCRACGRSFPGGPRAWYCPRCRIERQRESHARHRERRRNGDIRPLGSTDNCLRCGAEYKVTSPAQKYCPDCAVEAVKEKDREQGMSYYLDKKDIINPERNRRRRNNKRECPICHCEFTVYGKGIFCSESCRKEARKLRQKKYDAQRKGRKRGRKKTSRTPEEGGPHKNWHIASSRFAGGFEDARRCTRDDTDCGD